MLAPQTTSPKSSNKSNKSRSRSNRGRAQLNMSHRQPGRPGKPGSYGKPPLMGGAMGSPAGNCGSCAQDTAADSGPSQEIADTSSNVVREDFAHGRTATNFVANNNSASTGALITKSKDEVEEIKKKAPRLHREFMTAVEDYKKADTKYASEMAQVDINGILNSAPDDLDPAVARIRKRMVELFSRNDEKWKAKEAAKDLVLPSAEKIRQLARERGIRDPKALKVFLQKQFYYSAQNDELAQQAGGRDIAEVLLEKGALGKPA